MERRSPAKYISRITKELANSYFPVWMNASRNPISVMQKALVNPSVIFAEFLSQEIEKTKNRMFPQSLPIDIPSYFYGTNPDVVYDVDNLLYNNEQIYALDLAEDEEDFFNTDESSLKPDTLIYTNLITGDEYNGIAPDYCNIVKGDLYDEEWTSNDPVILNVISSIDTDNREDVGIYGRILYGTVVGNQGVFTGTTDEEKNIPDIEIRYDFSQKIYDHKKDYIRHTIFKSQEIFEERSAILSNGNDDYSTIIDVPVAKYVDIYTETVSGDEILSESEYEIIETNLLDTDNWISELDYNNNGIIDDEDRLQIVNRIGLSINNTTPEEWSKHSEYDLNGDGEINDFELTVINNAYMNTSLKDKCFIRFFNPGKYTVSVTRFTDEAIVSTYTKDNTTLLPISGYTYGESTFNFFEDFEDISYDPVNNVYWCSSKLEHCIYAIYIEDNFIKDKVKVPVLFDYDSEVRGICFDNGFVYVLIFNHDSKKCKVAVYDTKRYIKPENEYAVLEVEDYIFHDPTSLNITEEGRYIITDYNSFVILKGIRDRIYINGNTLISYKDLSDKLTDKDGNPVEMYYRYLWNEYDEYGSFVFGIDRLPGESNLFYYRRMMSVYRNLPLQTRQGVINRISNGLGLPTYTVYNQTFITKYAPDFETVAENSALYIDYNRIDSIITGDDNGNDTYNFIDSEGDKVASLSGYSLLFESQSYLDDKHLIDLVYPVRINDEEIIQVQDTWKVNNRVPLIDGIDKIEVNELHNEDYLEANSYITGDHEPTDKLIDILDRINNLTDNRFMLLKPYDSLYDVNYNEEDTIIIPTKMDKYSNGKDYLSGIGFGKDLNLEGFKTHTEDVLAPEEFIGSEIPDILTVEEDTYRNNEWHPVINPGWFYYKGEEYFCFSNKITEVFTLNDLEEDEDGYRFKLTNSIDKFSPVIIHQISYTGDEIKGIYKQDEEYNNSDFLRTLGIEINSRFVKGYDYYKETQSVLAYNKYILESELEDPSLLFDPDIISGDNILVAYYSDIYDSFTDYDTNINPLITGKDKGFVCITTEEERVSDVNANNIVAYSAESSLFENKSTDIIIEITDSNGKLLNDKEITVTLTRKLYDGNSNEIQIIDSECVNDLVGKYRLQTIPDEIVEDNYTISKPINNSSQFYTDNYYLLRHTGYFEVNGEKKLKVEASTGVNGRYSIRFVSPSSISKQITARIKIECDSQSFVYEIKCIPDKSFIQINKLSSYITKGDLVSKYGYVIKSLTGDVTGDASGDVSNDYDVTIEEATIIPDYLKCYDYESFSVCTSVNMLYKLTDTVEEATMVRLNGIVEENSIKYNLIDEDMKNNDLMYEYKTINKDIPYLDGEREYGSR